MVTCPTSPWAVSPMAADEHGKDAGSWLFGCWVRCVVPTLVIVAVLTWVVVR